MQKRLLGKEQRKSPSLLFGNQADLGSVSIALALGIYLCTFIMYKTTLAIYFPSWFTRVAQIVCLGFLLIAELQRGRYSFRELLALGILIVVALIAFCAGSGSLFVMAVIIVVARNYDYEKLLKIVLFCVVVCCAIAVAASLLGFSLNYVWDQGGRVRYGLGFKYTSFLSQHIFFGTLVYVFLKKGKVRLLPCIGIVLLAGAAYLVSDSRNPFIMTILVIVMMPFFSKKKLSHRKQAKWIAIVFFCLLVAFSVVLMFVYDSTVEWERELNVWLGGRLAIAHWTYELHGLSLFGQDVLTVGQGLGDDLQMNTFPEGITYIDNSYCSVLFHYGPIALLLFAFLFCTLIWRAANNGDGIFLLVLLLIAIHSYIDSFWLVLQYDAFWLLIGSYAICYKDNRIRQKKLFGQSV